jgi:hypothetical protein
MTLRLVQIGLGGWGRNWVEEVTRNTQGVEPVAWVDLDPATRERAAVDLDLHPERGVRPARAGAVARQSRIGERGLIALAIPAGVTFAGRTCPA